MPQIIFSDDERAEIDRLVAKYSMAVVTQHVGEQVYLPPGDDELEADYADAFTYAVAEVHRRLWPVKLGDLS